VSVSTNVPDNHGSVINRLMALYIPLWQFSSKFIRTHWERDASNRSDTDA